MLACTPKPTNPYPQSVQVPSRIRGYADIIHVIEQFPLLTQSRPRLGAIGLSNAWVASHRPELVAYLIGFMAGDAGKDYPRSSGRSRHDTSSCIDTNMSKIVSNRRLLEFVGLCLEVFGIPSHFVRGSKHGIRFKSGHSRMLSWILEVCLGLKADQRTSRDKIDVTWIPQTTHEFKVHFIQAVADSDGSVDRNGYYVNIETIPNPELFARILRSLGTTPHVYQYPRQSCVRVSLADAVRLPIFNPVVCSYRYVALMDKARMRNISPPDA